MRYHRRDQTYQSPYRLIMIASKQGLGEKKRGTRVNSLQHCLYLTYLCGNRVDGPEKQTSNGVFSYSEHLCVTVLMTACLVDRESKKVFFENEQVQVEISIISCLITSQIAIFRQDKSVPSCFVSFRLDCFILRLTEKVILWVVLVNRVIQK